MTSSDIANDKILAGEREPAIGAGDVVDDMHDSVAVRDFARSSPPLFAALQQIDEVLVTRYEEHDTLGTRAQRRFHFVIFVTAWGGALAVLGAVAQLMFVAADAHTYAHLSEKFEAVMIVLTMIGILAGLRLAQIENWLVDRFKAEQLRLLKFRMLLDPRMWGNEEQRSAWRAELVRRRDIIVSVTHAQLAQESERDVVPWLPTSAECEHIEERNLRSLLEYYRRTRIETQERQFAAEAVSKPSWLDKPRLLPLIFFASVVLVGLHVAIEQGLQRLPSIFGPNELWWTRLSIVVMALSIGVFIIWAGIRTSRSAKESTQHVVRAAARRNMLAEASPLIDRLQDSEPALALCQLQMLEIVLESDQREWLRNMQEVEWYVDRRRIA